VGKGGIVRDPLAHEKVVEGVRQAARELGLTVSGLCESPIKGADGNVEFLILLDIPEIDSVEALMENCIFCVTIQQKST
jgi:23S rRNA (cytidine1920-2'-O)/16S rRNA (cytidine1409-2'-O)-methyltransferase